MTPKVQNLFSSCAVAFDRFVNNAVADSMNACYEMAKPKTPAEPDFIAHLVCDAMPKIGVALNDMFTKIGGDARVTAVFCHGRPQVDRAGVKCELGDVLFAFFHTDGHGNTYRNSILLQAKMTKSDLLTIGKKEEHQLALYEGWGKFSYWRTSGLSGKKRIVSPTSAHSGAQYLLIDDRGPTIPDSGLMKCPDTFPMGLATAQRHLALYEDIGKGLRCLICGNNGRTFLDKKNARKDWSRVVWDLLKHGAERNFTQKRVGIESQTRSVDAIHVFANGDSVVTSGAENIKGEFSSLPPNGRGPRNQDNPNLVGDDGGVSVIVIETNERSNEKD